MELLSIKQRKASVNIEYFLLFASAALLFVVYISNIRNSNVLQIIGDEAGYWAIAAYFAGYDWSNVISGIIPYYSFGYSILLVPLFWLFETPSIIYQAAIIFNAFLMTLNFIFLYLISKKLFINKFSLNLNNKISLLLLSICVSFYPSVLVQRNSVWPECTLIFLCTLLTWMFFSLTAKSSTLFIIILSIITAFLFMVHQRTVGIVLSSILVIFLMYYCKKITLMQLLFFFITFVVMMFFFFVLRKLVIQNVYKNASLGNNGFSGVFNTLLASINSPRYWIRLLFTFIGQLFYLGVTTFLLFYFAIFNLLKSVVKGLKIIKQNNEVEQIYFVYFYLFISFFLTFCISVIFISGGELARREHMFYGRYNEIILIPILLLGIFNNIFGEKIQINIFLFYIFIFIAIGYGTYLGDKLLIKNTTVGNFVVPGIFLHRLFYEFNYFFIVFLSVLCFSLIYLINFMKFRQYFIPILIMSIFFASSLVPINYSNRNRAIFLKSGVKETIKKLNLNNNSIYYLYEKNKNKSVVDMLRYQFFLHDRKILPISLKECYSLDGDVFVIVSKFEEISELFFYDFFIYCEDENVVVYKKRTKENNLSESNIKTLAIYPSDVAFLYKFHSFERNGFIWTKDLSSFYISLISGRDNLLRVTYGGFPEYIFKQKFSYFFTFEINNNEIFQKEITFDNSISGCFEFSIPAEFIIKDDLQRIDILSETWCPKELTNSTDSRQLGISILKIEVVGGEIDFTSRGSTDTVGFHPVETQNPAGHFAWTKNKSSFSLSLVPAKNNRIRVVHFALPDYIFSEKDAYIFKFAINGIVLAEKQFTVDTAAAGSFEIEIPANLVNIDDLTTIDILSDIWSPKELGVSEDDRKLGLPITKIEVIGTK